MSNVTKSKFLPFPLNLPKTAIRSLGERFVWVHFCNDRVYFFLREAFSFAFFSFNFFLKAAVAF